MHNPNALRKAKIVHNFGLSECNRVNEFVSQICLIFFEQSDLGLLYLLRHLCPPISIVYGPLLKYYPNCALDS